MRKHRIIPVVLFRNGFVVQSKEFKYYKNLGNPLLTINRLSEWGADEICFLDISQSNIWENGRTDLNESVATTFLDVLRDVSKVAYMPLACGGGIRSIEDIEQRIRLGADKVIINSAFLHNPNLVREAVAEFGSQCIVASIDVMVEDKQFIVYVNGGTVSTGIDLVEWIKKVEGLGAGEILLNSIDKDGSKSGYDMDMLSMATKQTSIPVIACGGVGKWSHFAEALRETDIDAVAAANIFHHQDQSVYQAHKELLQLKFAVRPPTLHETDYSKRR